MILQGSGFLGSGSTGRRLPLRLFVPTKVQEMPTVVVFGKGGTFAQQEVPFVRVKDCDADPFLRLEAQKRSDEGRAVYELQASLGAEGLTNVVWTFGDGSTGTSQGSSVTHDYGQRGQRIRFSEFLISATATDAKGRTVRGYQTLELLNREYLQDRQGARAARSANAENRGAPQLSERPGPDARLRAEVLLKRGAYRKK